MDPICWAYGKEWIDKKSTALWVLTSHPFLYKLSLYYVYVSYCWTHLAYVFVRNVDYEMYLLTIRMDQSPLQAVLPSSSIAN